MKNEREAKDGSVDVTNEQTDNSPSPLTRRRFLGNVGGAAALGGAATVGMASGLISLEPLLGGKHSVAEASTIPYDSLARADASFEYRKGVAVANHIDIR